jgi:hypothetical protein
MPGVRRLVVPDAAAFVAIAVAIGVAAGPVRNFDLFFHLAGGRWILEHGFARTFDPFSVTGNPPAPHEWLFGVWAELMVRWLGAAGPEILTAALVAATLILFWRTLGPPEHRGLTALFLFLAGAKVMAYSWEQERPFHVTHLFFAATILLVQAWRRGRERVAWLLPPLVAIWANLHGAWLTGPALLGATAVGCLFDAAGPADRRVAWKGFAIAAGSILAAGLSPLGISAYLFPIHHSLLQSTQRIMEWHPLDLGDLDGKLFFLLVVVAAVAVGRAPSARMALILPGVGLTLAAISQQRHVPLAGMFVASAASELLREGPSLGAAGAWRSAFQSVDRAIARFHGNSGGALLVLLVFLPFVVAARIHPVPLADRISPDAAPIRMILELCKLPAGKVLNRFRWGGAVSYFCGPDYKVFIDGRNDPFPQAIHDDYAKLRGLEPGWKDALTRYGPDYVAWDRLIGGNALIEGLRCQGDWRTVFDDGDAALLVRETVNR